MRADGVLTTIDPEPLHHRAARASFAGAAVSSGRTRLINGAPRDVLPRPSDRSYDLVFVDGPQLELPDFVVEAIRLLRPGGVLVVHDATAEGAIGDNPERNDPDDRRRPQRRDHRRRGRPAAAGGHPPR